MLPSSGRLGAAVAGAFIAEGAKIHVADVDAEAVRAIVAEHEGVSGSVTDVSDPVAVDALFNDVRADLGDSDAASIITMSSLAGRFGYPNRVGYSTTKWGLVGFAKTLAMELGPLGITSNSIHPGAVDGPRLMGVFEGRSATSGRTVQEEMDSALANQSVKQFIDPADIAALILFLAGPHARTISGQMFPIDGDSKAAV